MPIFGPTVNNVGRLRLYVEPSGSFAVDHTGTLGDFIDIPFTEGSVTMDMIQEMHDPGQAVQNPLDYRLEVLGRRGYTLNFSMPFAPTGTAAGDSTAALQGALGKLLKAIWGGEHLGTGSTVTSASTTVINVSSGAGFKAGGVAVWTDTNAVAHAREIAEVSGNVVTLKSPLPGTPAASDVLASGATYYMIQDPDTSLQFIYEGLEGDDRWVFLGGQGTVSFELGLDGSVQTASFTITGADFLHAQDSAGTAQLIDTDLGASTYSNFSPIPGHVGRFRTGTVGVSDAAEVCVSALSFEPQIAYQEITCPSGKEGRKRYRMSRQMGTVMQGSFTTFYEAEDDWDRRDNRSVRWIEYQNGSAAGKSILMSAATIQVVNAQRMDDNGIAGQQVTWKARLDSATTETSATDMGRSPARIHLC